MKTAKIVLLRDTLATTCFHTGYIQVWVPESTVPIMNRVFQIAQTHALVWTGKHVLNKLRFDTRYMNCRQVA